MHADASQRSSRLGLSVLFSAFLATVSAIFGYDLIACSGLLAGAISALMRAGFLILVDPWTLVVCLGMLAAFAGIARWLATCRPFRERKELLAFVVPLSAFMGGIAVGMFSDMGIRCALHPWAQ